MKLGRTSFQLGSLPGGKRSLALAIAIVFALFSAWAELADPVSVGLLGAASHVRRHDGDGTVVVVGIDDKSFAALHGFPWSHAVEARFINSAMAQGAKTIAYDRIFLNSETPAADKALVDALDHSHGRVYFGVTQLPHPETGGIEVSSPAPVFRGHARLGVLQVETGFDGYANKVPRVLEIQGKPVPSLSAIAADGINRAGDAYLPDYAINAQTIPSYSYVDVLDGRVPRGALAGKSVLVGAVSTFLHDYHWVPGQGQLPGVYTHAIGALSLRSGACREIGWWPGLIVSFLAAFFHLFARRRARRLLALALGLALLVGGPMALAQWGINTDPGSALVMLAGLAVWNALYSRSHRHAGTDLPNLTAFRRDRDAARRTIIVMRLHNFAEIMSSLDVEGETVVAQEIVRRLRIGAQAGTVYQTERGEYAFLSELTADDDLGAHLDGLHAMLRQPLRIASRYVDLKFGFGVDTSFDTPRTVTVRLSSAMIVAAETEQTGARWAAYDIERADRIDWELALLGELDRAVAEREVYPAYQPKVDLKSGVIIGFEALARWDHPTRGAIAADVFIQAAENNNRIAELTWHMLRQCLADASELRRRGLVSAIAVNLSTGLLGDPSLVKRIGDMLRAFNYPPGELTLELTETGKAISGRQALAAIATLRKMGVRISLDDFGAGNATMDYAHDFTADEIKIDRKFVTTLTRDAPAQAIVTSLIAMANRLGCKIVAEGIEDAQTRALLIAMGCPTGQGFGLHRPKKFAEIIDLLENPPETQRAAS